MSHSPEVLADLVARLRRERPAADALPATSSSRVYFIPREEIGAAYAGRVLDVDRAATAALCSEVDVYEPPTVTHVGNMLDLLARADG